MTGHTGSKDITRALALIDDIQARHPVPDASVEQFAHLRQILTDIDARRTKRDPHLRPKKKPVKKAAKKAAR